MPVLLPVKPTLRSAAKPPVKQTAPRRPNLERQAISFTVVLYMFICLSLLVIHYAVPDAPPAATTGDSSPVATLTHEAADR